MREKAKTWEPTLGPRRLAPKWVALLVGTCVAIPGLWGVVANVPLFDKFATRSWMEVREGPGYHIDASRLVRSSDMQHVLRYDGFEPGTTALFCMLCFTVGVGISTCRFLDVTGRQNLWLFMGVAWHVLGIPTLVAYVRLAPRPFGAWPLIAISVYEWCGLFLIALGMRKHWFAGKLHDAAWNLWVGRSRPCIAGSVCVPHCEKIVKFTAPIRGESLMTSKVVLKNQHSQGHRLGWISALVGLFCFVCWESAEWPSHGGLVGSLSGQRP